MQLLKPNLQAILEAASADAAMLLPPHYKCRPDLVNLDPTDLVARGDGGRLAGSVNVGDLVPGAISPGIWHYYPSLNILACVTFMLGVVAAYLGAWIPLSTIFDAWQAGSGVLGSVWFAIKMTAFGWMLWGAMPAAGVVVQAYYWWLVLAEQEPSRDMWRVFVLATSIIVALCILVPLVGPLGCACTSLLSIFAFRLYVGAVEKSRESILVDITNDTRTSSIAKGIEAQEEARRKQALESAGDTTHLIKIGNTDGTLRRDGDPLTRDKGGAFCMSLKDLRNQNVLVTGRSRCGKTSAVLRPMARQLRAATWNSQKGRSDWGMLMLDGKKTLPFDLAEVLDYVLTPENCKLNLLDGVSVEVAASIMLKVCVMPRDKDGWAAQAESMWRHAMFMVSTLAGLRKPDGSKAYPDIHWSLHSAKSWYANREMREQVMTDAFDRFRDAFAPHHLFECWVYWGVTQPAIHAEGWSSVKGIVDSWIDGLVSHSALGNWITHETDHHILDFICREGGWVGVVAPEEVYGVGGKLASMLVDAGYRNRISSHSMLPGGDWVAAGENPTVLLVDEFSGLATSAHAGFAATCLGNGCTMILAIQNDEQLENPSVMGKESAEELRENCAGQFTFPSSFNTVSNRCKSAGYRNRWFPDDKNVQAAPLLQMAKAELANGRKDRARGRVALMTNGVIGAIATRKKQLTTTHHLNQADMEASNLQRASATLRGFTEHTTTVKPEEAMTFLSVPYKILAKTLVAGVENREFVDVIPDYKMVAPNARSATAANAAVAYQPPDFIEVNIGQQTKNAA